MEDSSVPIYSSFIAEMADNAFAKVLANLGLSISSSTRLHLH